MFSVYGINPKTKIADKTSFIFEIDEAYEYIAKNNIQNWLIQDEYGHCAGSHKLAGHRKYLEIVKENI